MLCSRSARLAAEGAAAKTRTVKSELARLAASGRITATERKRAAGGLQRRQARGQAAPARHHPPARAERRGRHRRGHRGAPEAERPAARAAVADARHQPRLLDDPHHRAVHAPDLVLGLPARLAVLPGPGPAVPPARQLREAQRAVVLEEQHGRRPAARRAARRCASRAPAASPGSTTSRSAAAGRRGCPASPRAPACEAMSRVAKRLGRQDEVLPILKQALGIFQDEHAGGRARADQRRPRVRAVLVRARPARHQRLPAGAGRALRPRQDTAATPTPRRCTPRASGSRGVRCRTYDTGAWSLYSRGSSRARVRPLLPPAA